MYVFKLGSGFSGPSIKVEPSFEMEECMQDDLFTQNDTDGLSELPFNLETSQSAHTEIIESSQPKRLILVLFFIFDRLDM